MYLCLQGCLNETSRYKDKTEHSFQEYLKIAKLLSHPIFCVHIVYSSLNDNVNGFGTGFWKTACTTFKDSIKEEEKQAGQKKEESLVKGKFSATSSDTRD